MRRKRGSVAQICMAMSWANCWNSSVRATKSDSQLTSTRTPIFPPAWIYEPTTPSDVVRPAFFAADAKPRLRSTVKACSISPLASSSARLHSIMGAPLISRNFFTCSGEALTGSNPPDTTKAAASPCQHSGVVIMKSCRLLNVAPAGPQIAAHLALKLGGTHAPVQDFLGGQNRG